MKLLYISTYMFKQKEDGMYGLPSSTDLFFEKFLKVFDSVRILGEKVKTYLDDSNLVKIKNENISVRILPRNTAPSEFKNDKILKKALIEEIKQAEAILIKPATRRGMMAIKIAKKLNKPYMIEVTGDIHNAMRQSESLVRRMYAPILYRQILRNIKDCAFGLYHSEYLQKEFPIKGNKCICADHNIEKSSKVVLDKRLEKIDNMKDGDTIKLALIGFYHGLGKGVDTAIRALSRLPENFVLSILGNGTSKSREMWYDYARKYGVAKERISFPEPLDSPLKVLEWLDDYDCFVFPTRSEGFGRCVLEAMSRGCPCFATNICTMPELLQKECLFELGNDRQLAEKLQYFVKNKIEMKRIAEENFEKAKEYDFELLQNKRDAFLQDFKEYCEEKLN